MFERSARRENDDAPNQRSMSGQTTFARRGACTENSLYISVMLIEARRRQFLKLNNWRHTMPVWRRDMAPEAPRVSATELRLLSSFKKKSECEQDCLQNLLKKMSFVASTSVRCCHCKELFK